METLYDGYVVNAILDACYASARSKRWEPVELDWRGGPTERIAKDVTLHDGHAALGAAGTRIGFGLLGWRSLGRRRLNLFQLGLLHLNLGPNFVYPLAQADQLWLSQRAGLVQGQHLGAQGVDGLGFLRP
jgi:hypothetical protein